MSCDPFDKPGSPWDYALLGAVGVACVPFIAANAVIFIHRSRRYFRAQGGALLILTNSIAGLVWIAATFVVNFHFPRNHKLLLICPLWSFWLQLAFGFWLWLVCQIVRLLHLQQLCHKADSPPSANARKFHILIYGLFLWIPCLVFTIAATASHASISSQEGSVCANCIIRPPWKICSYTVTPIIYVGIVGTLLYFSRNSKDYLMSLEHMYTFEYSLIWAAVIFLLMASTSLTESRKKVPGRLFLTFCICFLIFVNFWVRLGNAVYICAFKNASDMDSFEEKLRSYGAACLDDLCSKYGNSQVQTRTSASLQYSDWILKAIDAAIDEASECKERIAQLEKRKLVLSARSQKLETSSISPRNL